MPTITIKQSSRDLIESLSLTGKLNNEGAVFHDNGTVSIYVDDEVNDILHSRIDDITPTIDDVIVQLCGRGESLDG